MLKPRKIPLRRCTGCLEMKNKKEMLRVVHNENNEFFLDFTGKKQGRGAYVCKSMDCFEKAAKSKGLDRSFGCAVPKEIYETLRNQFVQLEKLETEKNK